LRKCVTHYDTFNKLQSVVGFLRKGGIRTAGLFVCGRGYLKEEIATLQHLLFGNKKAE